MQTVDYERLAMRTEADQEAIRKRKERQLRQMAMTTEQGGCRVLDGNNVMRLENGVRGLTDEVGEMNAILKKWIEYGRPLDIINIKEEVGDCLWRLVQICKAIGVTLSECMELNIVKLQARYPEKFNETQASNRDLDAERKALESNLHRFTIRGQGSDMPGHCRDCYTDWSPETDQQTCRVRLSDALKNEI